MLPNHFCTFCVTVVCPVFIYLSQLVGTSLTFSSVLPHQTKSFLDFKAGGALCHILGSTYKFKSEQGW